MLPGYISGHYAYDDCHIDLARLARFAGARLLHCEAMGLDTAVRSRGGHACLLHAVILCVCGGGGGGCRLLR